MAVVIIYYFSTFLIYATADFLRWRTSYDKALLKHLRTEEGHYFPEFSPKDKPWQRTQKEIEGRIWWWGTLSRKAATIRAVWEFALPLVVGLYAIAILLWKRHYLGSA